MGKVGELKGEELIGIGENYITRNLIICIVIKSRRMSRVGPGAGMELKRLACGVLAWKPE